MSDQTIPLSDKERADMLRMMYDEKVSELTAARAELNAANDLLNKQQERWAADLETARKEMDRATESSHQSLRRQAIDARAELETYRDSCAAKADRIAQAVFVCVPPIEWEEVAELGATVRGEGGFGSTGR
jgi:hypothetical protein